MSTPPQRALRIGTRRSALALAQAEQVAALLGGCEIVPMQTSGDRGAKAGEKSRWVGELERALQAGEIDLAVHSAKDVPAELGEGLALHGAPARAGAEDVLCGAGGLQDLAPGARVGTSSVRRLAQLRAAREDLDVVAVRGNVDTRLRKLGDPGERLDAIVLARAGLQRLGREAEAGASLEGERFVPAPGQGILALEGRAEDERARGAARAITDAQTFACLLAERALARALDASCHTPLGAHAAPAEGGRLLLRAWAGLPDGSAWIADESPGVGDEPEALGRRVAERLIAVGAAELLAQAERMAVC
ncbi:MAG TPA: hydroxymethylbilane synthase [Solirubrobacteraceae bacterium]|nr:hydroxymethylbilane synthase [Solirubrobacteraceae bacterium]